MSASSSRAAARPHWLDKYSPSKDLEAVRIHFQRANDCLRAAAAFAAAASDILSAQNGLQLTREQRRAENGSAIPEDIRATATKTFRHLLFMTLNELIVLGQASHWPTQAKQIENAPRPTRNFVGLRNGTLGIRQAKIEQELDRSTFLQLRALVEASADMSVDAIFDNKYVPAESFAHRLDFSTERLIDRVAAWVGTVQTKRVAALESVKSLSNVHEGRPLTETERQLAQSTRKVLSLRPTALKNLDAFSAVPTGTVKAGSRPEMQLHRVPVTIYGVVNQARRCEIEFLDFQIQDACMAVGELLMRGTVSPAKSDQQWRTESARLGQAFCGSIFELQRELKRLPKPEEVLGVVAKRVLDIGPGAAKAIRAVQTSGELPVSQSDSRGTLC